MMTISVELEATILRYYHVEKWRVGTIARQLKIHHNVVNRVLSKSGIPKSSFMRGKSIITPFLPFILETLEKFPTLTASRLYQMVRQRDYKGGEDHFRHLLSLHRPRRSVEAFLRLRTLPGEQAQVDWGHFGYIEFGKAKRPLMAFVMVLSYSRKIFLKFYLNAQMSNFLRGHEDAFQAFGGVPRVLLYDNLRSAVLERRGEAIHFHPTLLEFAGYYRYEPRPVAVARGNEKGRVERAIRYVRDNFFAARTWKNIDDLNEQAKAWCEGIAADRPCPEDKSLSVREVFLQEQTKLFPLPADHYPTDERVEAKSGKTPYVRFDLNDYSIPHSHVRRVLTVIAKIDTVSILDGIEVVANHPRSYEKGAQIEDENHIAALSAEKKQARLHRGQDRLAQAIPSSRLLLQKAAERQYNLGSIVSELLTLLDRYGAAELEASVQEALARDVPHPNGVRIALEKRREDRELPPPIQIDLPNDKRVRDLVVKPHNLGNYDFINTVEEEK